MRQAIPHILGVGSLSLAILAALLLSASAHARPPQDDLLLSNVPEILDELVADASEDGTTSTERARQIADQVGYDLDVDAVIETVETPAKAPEKK